MAISPAILRSPMPSPINPTEIKAIALKVKQRLSSRRSESLAETSTCSNPLAPPLCVDHLAASELEMGAPRPTDSGPRVQSTTPDSSFAATPPVLEDTWSSEFDVDTGTGATPTPYLSPRSRECTAELLLAPTSYSCGAASSTECSHSVELGPWPTNSVETPTGPFPTIASSTGPPGRAVLHCLPQLSLAPVDDEAAVVPAAPRGPPPVNDLFSSSSSQTMESVRLSGDSGDSEADLAADWSGPMSAATVSAVGSPDTVHACSGLPVPGPMRRAHTMYRFRVTHASGRGLLIETRYCQMHKLKRLLDGLLRTADLPTLPPKLRGATRLSGTVIAARHAAFRGFIEAAIARITALREEHTLSKREWRRGFMSRPRKERIDAASAAMQQFLTKSAIMAEDDFELGTERQPVPAEWAGGGAMVSLCGGGGGDRRHRRRTLTSAVAALASAIVAGPASPAVSESQVQVAADAVDSNTD